ncbi:major facilitator superfamily domain-containing protein [Xylariaceae sp. FL0804]|nr:major facilitator superfamily domain-containing protein [Xylariaceae sp. FL0804]
MSQIQTQTQDAQGIRFRLAIVATSIATFAVALDGLSLAAALPVVSESIPGTQVETFWAGVSYLLASTSCVFLWISLSDALGRQRTFIVVLLVLVAGSIVCATASTYSVLIVGRTIQGLAGGGVLGLTYVVLTDMVPLLQRAKYLSLINSIFGLGSIIGPVIGGACAVTGAWRWIFWLNLPVAALSSVGIFFCLKLNRRDESLANELRKIDWPGLVLFAASVTAFLVPVTWGGIQFPWGSWHTIVPIVVGLIGIVAFGLYEGYITSKPFLPLYIFRSSTTSIIYIGSFINGVLLYTQVYYVPEYFQSVKLYSPLIAGVAALPGSLTVMPSAALTGIIVGKTGHYRWAIWTGWGLASLGFGVMCLLDVHTSIPAWIFIRIAAGLGTGILLPALNIALQASVPQREIVMATTMFQFLRDLGHTVGVSIGSSILDNVVRTQLHKPDVASIVPANLTDLSAVKLISVLKSMPAESDVALALRSALAQSFVAIWATMTGLSGLGLLIHLFTKEYDLNQKLITDQSWARDSEAKELMETAARSETQR